MIKGMTGLLHIEESHPLFEKVSQLGKMKYLPLVLLGQSAIDHVLELGLTMKYEACHCTRRYLRARLYPLTGRDFLDYFCVLSRWHQTFAGERRTLALIS